MLSTIPPTSASGGTRQGGSLSGPGGFLGPRRVCNRPFQGNSGPIPTSPPTARPAAGCRGCCGAGPHRPPGTTGRTPLPILQTRTPRARAAPRTEGSPPRPPRKCCHPPPQRTKPRLRQTHCPRSLSSKGPSGHPEEAQEGCPRWATQPAHGFPRLRGGVPPPSNDKAAPPARHPLPTAPLQGGAHRNLAISKEEVFPTRLSHRIQCSGL